MTPMQETKASVTFRFFKILILDLRELHHSAKISQIIIPLQDISSETLKDINNERDI
jgi:hypothetical protein